MKNLKRLWASVLSVLIVCSIILSSVDANALVINDAETVSVSGNDEICTYDDKCNHDEDMEDYIVDDVSSSDAGEEAVYDDAESTPVEYTITYKLDGGTNAEENPAVYTTESEDIVLAAPSKTGYTFAGWFKDSKLTKAVTVIKAGSTGNKVFYAKWSVNKYNVKFDGNGSTSGTMKTLKSKSYSTKFTLTENAFSKKGYTFTGWNINADGSGISYANKAKVSKLSEEKGATVTLYAQWTVKTYKITYKLNGGTNSEENPSTYTINDEEITLAAPVREGAEFLGWYSDSSFKKAATIVKSGSTGTKTFYAKWKVYKYNIKFDGNGATSGTMKALKSRSCGTKYTLTENVYKRKGYTFAGWNTQADGLGTSYANKAKVINLSIENGTTVTLYAQWKPINYTITYKLNGGVNCEENPKTYTIENAVILSSPAKDNCLFLGWYTDSKFTKEATGIKVGSTGAKTFYAKWEVCQHSGVEKSCIRKATCVSPNVFRVVCMFCDKVLDEHLEEGEINPDAHSYDEGKVTKESTETEDGECTYTCTLCGNSYIEVIPKLGEAGECQHDFVYQFVTEKATREHSGTKLFICDKCGYEKEEEFVYKSSSEHGCYFTPDEDYLSKIEKSGEEPDINLAVPCVKCGAPSRYGEYHDSNGKIYYYISLKGSNHTIIFKDEITGNYVFEDCDVDVCKESGGHSQSVYKAIGEGKYKVYCDICDAEVGEIDINKRKACNHSLERYDFYRFPKNDELGRKEVYCADCGLFLRYESAPRINHDEHSYVYFTREATCSAYGSESGVCYCSNKIWARIAKLPHEYSDMVVVTEATCTTKGLEESRCKNCSAFYSREIPSTGHDYELKETVKATCKDDGYYLYECNNCKETQTQTVYRNNSHVYAENYVVVTESTCNQYGTGVIKCTVCDKDLMTVRIPLAEHKYEWVVVKEPTYSEDGERDEKCTVCERVRTREVIICEEKKNCQHTGAWGITVKKIADCMSPKIYNKICADCLAVIDDNYVTSNDLNPTNHTKIVKNVVREKTATQAGLVTYSCVDCGKIFEFNTTKTYDECVHYDGRTRITENDKACEYCNTCGEVARVLGLACTHSVTKRQVVRQEATETQDGIVDIYCPGCNDFIETKTVHAYKTYYIDLGNGETGTVMGWVEDEYNDTVIAGEDSYLDENGWSYEVFVLENEYRRENGLNELEWNYYLQEAANLRAVEAAYDFSHTRPNGEPWYTANRTFMSGENLGIGHKDPETIMQGWKNSEGHNKNLLYPTFRSVAVGVFHMYTFHEGNVIPVERMVWAQNFSYIG